ncbi:hypothetical protein ABK040_003442 [Willaertia magna]
MFKKLQNKLHKDVAKFSFNLSIDYLFNYKPPKDKKEELTYAVFWKRGKKRKGETEFVKPEGSRIIWNRTYKFNGTLYNKKGKWQKKDLLLTLEEKGKNNKVQTIAKESIDLSPFVDADAEQTYTKEIDLQISKDNKVKLKIVINSKCLKDQNPNDEDFTAVSTLSGSFGEVDDDEGTNKDEEEEEHEEERHEDELEEEEMEEHQEEEEQQEEEQDNEFKVEDVNSFPEQQQVENHETSSNHSNHEEEENQNNNENVNEEVKDQEVVQPRVKFSSTTTTIEPKVEKKTETKIENEQPVVEKEKKSIVPKFLKPKKSAIKDLTSKETTSDLKEEIKKLQKQIKELQSNDKSSAVSQIQKERDNAIEKLKVIQMENEQLKKERDRAVEAQQDADNKLFELQLKQKQMQTKNDTQIKQLKEKLKQLEDDSTNEKQQLTEKLKNVQTEGDESDEQMLELEQTIERLKEDLSQLKEEKKSFQEILSNERKETAMARMEKENMMEELKNLKATYENDKLLSQNQLQTEIVLLQKEIENQSEKRRLEVEELNTDLQRIKEERKNLVQKISVQSQELSNVSKEKILLLNCLQEFNALKMKLENAFTFALNEEIRNTNTYQEIVDTINSNNDSSLVENEVKKEIYQSSEVMITKLSKIQEENKKLQEKLENTEKDNNNLTDRVSLLSKQIEVLQNEKLSLLNEYSQEKQLLDTNLESYKSKLQSLEEEINDISNSSIKEKEMYKNEVEQANEQVKYLTEQLNLLQNGKSSTESQVSTLSQKIETLLKEKAELTQAHNKEKELLQNQIGETKEEINILEQQLTTQKQEREKFIKEINHLDEKLKSYEHTLKEKEDINSKVNVSLSETKNALIMEQQLLTEKETRIQTLSLEINQLKEQLDTYSKTIKEKEETISNVNNSLEEVKFTLQQQIDSLIDDRKKLEAALTSELQNMKRGRMIRRKRLESDTESIVNSKLNELLNSDKVSEEALTEEAKEVLSDSEKEAEKLKENENASVLLEAIKEERKKLEEEIKELKVSNDNLQKQLSEKEKGLNEKMEELALLSNSSLSNEDKKNKQLEKLESKVSKLKEENEVLEEKVSEMEEGITSKNKEINDLQQAMDELREDISGKNDEITKLHAQVLNIEDLLNGKDNEVKKLEKRVDILSNNLEEFEAKCNDLEVEIEGKDNEIKKLKNSLDNRGVEEGSLRDELDEKDRTIESLEEKLDKLQQQKEALVEEKELCEKTAHLYEGLKEEYALAQEKIADAEETINRLEMQLDVARNELGSMEEELKALEKEKEELAKKKTQEEESQKSFHATADKEIKKLKEELSNLQTFESEKYVIETAIIHSQPYEFLGSSKVPTPVKALFLCILRFSPESHKTFCTNVVRALRYVVDRYHRDSDMLIYWINVIYRLLNLLQHSGSEHQVAQALKQMGPITPRAVYEENEDSSIVEPPSYIVTDDGKENLIPNMQEFVNEICDVLSIAFENLCHRTIRNIKGKLLKAVFNPKQATSKSTDGEPEMKLCLNILSEEFKRFEAQKVEQRVVNYFFENLAVCLDAIVFNEFITNTVTTSKCLQIKMGVAFLENWFESRRIVQTISKRLGDDVDENDLVVSFSLSRQAADVCVISRKKVLSDEDMRKMVCPEITLPQIAYMFSNFEEDEFSDKLSSQEIEDLVGETPKLSNVLYKPNIDFLKYTDVSTKRQQKGNVFSFESLDGNGKINSLQLPQRFSARFEELSFLK